CPYRPNSGATTPKHRQPRPSPGCSPRCPHEPRRPTMRRKLSLLGLSLCLLLPGPALPAFAQQPQTQQTTPQTPPASGGSTLLGPLPRIQLGENEDFALPLQLLLLLTILSLAPAIIILTTSFTRLVVIFS